MEFLELKKKALDHLKKKNKLRFSFTVFSKEYSELTSFLVNHSLAHFKLNFLENIVITLIKELVNNAIKANLKRAYFAKQNIDIHDPNQYKIAIQQFREDAIPNLNEYVKILKSMKLKVQLFLQIDSFGILISVRNNTGMTSEELARVRDRVSHAREQTSIADAFVEFSDETEGAGLGLLLNIMLLRTTGIGVKNFHVSSNSKETTAALRIPLSVNTPSNLEKIQKEIFSKLDSIPTFP